ncbi:hypothetical protein [Bacillus toyonensis]|uniref:hypothetical protein n=1 Tax=Bacillus toyonensis TaxID=155322 RepID=UPI002E22C8B4|nr:hypothetical protein [Bacillus toyonensis]
MSHEDYLRSIGQKGKVMSVEKINFDTYFSKVINDPRIARNAVQRVYDMIMSYGTYEDDSGRLRYNFFKGRMFGAEKQINQIMDYFKAASMGLDIKKRILFFLGPPGGGKSMFLSLLKKGLADYTKTDKGAMYRIAGCPINEDPLHLIEDEETRKDIWSKYGIKIEGKLCPVCKHKLDHDWKNNISYVDVERFFVDEESRSGIGTFAPAEENDMSELYGSPNIRKIQEIGNEADPRAYDFNGELHKANRGVMEFIEVLKADASFLHILLTLAEEQQFKTPRFPLQYVDECLIAHTNEGEFYRFISVKENEAIVDRLYIVQMPYNMNYKYEEMIYHAALKTKLVVKGITVHPGAVRLASIFAITTRKSTEDDELRNGMQGISPRFILNALAISMVKASSEIVTPTDMYNTLYSQISHYPVLDSNTRNTYLNILNALKQQIEVFNQVTVSDVLEEKEINRKTKLFDRI